MKHSESDFAGKDTATERPFHCPLPGHSNGDLTPSASLNTEKGAWYCQACGGKGDIFSMAGHIHGLSRFPDQLEKVAQVLGVNSGSLDVAERQTRIVNIYPYHDETGNLLYEVLRLDPKTFRQRRPDGKGGWIWNLKDTRRVLYRLPDLQGKKTVYIVEGEKDADRLWSLGIPATTSPMGAGKWRPIFNEQLKSAGVENVVIIPDNDEPGEKHAIAVSRSCIKAKFKTKIVRLPDPGEHGDVSDWFGAGNTKEDLARIVQDTPILLVAPEEIPAEQKNSNPKEDRKSKKQGRELNLTEPEPWPNRVDGAILLDEITATFRRYLALRDGSAEAMSLWAVFSHAIDAFQTAPRLAFTSPEKRCGKTTALSLISLLVPRPLPAANITPAAVFRVVEAFQPTLLIDEADTFLKDNDELRGILNSGHYRPAAYVLRLVGEGHEPRRFSTWAAMVIAMIGNLPDTLEDRSVEIKMRRRGPDEVVESFRYDRAEHLNDLARKATRWALDNAAAIKKADPSMPEGLHDRAADNWRPLIAIAEVAGGEWPERARMVAVALSVSDEGDGESIRTRLLFDLRNLFEERDVERLFSATICDVLGSMEDRPWSEWRKGKPITQTQLARQLKPFGVTPKTIRMDDGRAKGYLLSDLSDAFSRYLPPSKRDTVTSQCLQGNPAIPKRDKNFNVTDENSPNPAPVLDCHGVTDGIGESPQEGLWEDEF